MAATALSKKEGTKTHRAPPKKKQKKEFFRSKKKDVSDSSDEEGGEEHEEVVRDEEDSGPDSDISSQGDDPLARDFLQGSDDEEGNAVWIS